MKKILLALTIISFTLYLLTIRGNLGTPTPHSIEYDLSRPGEAFETSQERSRYAMLLSIVNHGTINIDPYASMGTPDIGKIGDHYYSFFPPAVSIAAIPLYHLGQLLNATQIMVFLVSTIFAFLTMIMMVIFASKLNLHWSIALFVAIAFGFATNAWGYSVTFYAHLVSAFLLISALYFATFIDSKNKYINSFMIWILYSIAVFVDFPNLFIFLPIAFFTFFKAFSIESKSKQKILKINWGVFLMPFIFVTLMACYALYNNYHFGSPTTLSNAIPRVKDLKETVSKIPESENTAVSALNTRNLLNGLMSFTVNQDRGVLVFSPIVALFLLSLKYILKKENQRLVLLLSVPTVCLVLYSMFGDPYGGWAFGSRYMIAIYPPLLILAGIALQHMIQNLYIKILFTVLFVYSAAVSLLSPLTTNVIPPTVEAGTFGLRDDYFINIEMLARNDLNSFMFNNYLHNYMTGMAYYIFILSFLVSIGVMLIWWPTIKKYGNKN